MFILDHSITLTSSIKLNQLEKAGTSSKLCTRRPKLNNTTSVVRKQSRFVTVVADLQDVPLMTLEYFDWLIDNRDSEALEIDRQ